MSSRCDRGFDLPLFNTLKLQKNIDEKDSKMLPKVHLPNVWKNVKKMKLQRK